MDEPALTGQVPVSSTYPCPNHKVVAHDAAGRERYCNACGRDKDGVRVAPPSGGWGTSVHLRP